MSGNFAPGDLVVANYSEQEREGWVDDKYPGCRFRAPPTHTVMTVIAAYANNGEPTISLAEYMPHMDWVSREFRPVDPRRLEIFRKALTGRPVTEEA